MKNRTVAYWLLSINAINLITLVAYPYMLIISFYMFASSNTDDYILEYIAAGCWLRIRFPSLHHSLAGYSIRTISSKLH